MPVPNVRPMAPEPSEPLLHDLPPIQFEGRRVSIRLAVRRTEDGIWRARLHFIDETETERITAEIFCATTEQDLWQAVRDLREHNMRDLFRSLTT
jgi:hypothetical protein